MASCVHKQEKKTHTITLHTQHTEQYTVTEKHYVGCTCSECVTPDVYIKINK